MFFASHTDTGFHPTSCPLITRVFSPHVIMYLECNIDYMPLSLGKVTMYGVLLSSDMHMLKHRYNFIFTQSLILQLSVIVNTYNSQFHSFLLDQQTTQSKQELEGIYIYMSWGWCERELWNCGWLVVTVESGSTHRVKKTEGHWSKEIFSFYVNGKFLNCEVMILQTCTDWDFKTGLWL